MVRSRQLRAPFVITLASVASTLAACGGSTATDKGAGGSAVTGGSGGSGNVSGSGGSGAVSGSGGTVATGGTGGSATCPPSYPQDSTPCSLPDGTSCNYDQGNCCPPWEAICQGGKWQGFASSCNPPPPEPCPGTPPSNGAACGGGGPCATSQSCSYGQCADGSALMIADCVNGAWDVAIANCQPMPCEQLSACDCFDRPDCEALSDSCICSCDFNCPGDPPCDCVCGGGQFLGCQTKNSFP
jgi:hypothetical protein